MDSETQQKQVTRQDTFSILETLDVFTGERTVLHEFDTIMEAPNWTQDGKYLVYNAEGYIYTYELATGDIKAIDTGFATKCNNDHVLSPDNAQLAVSHHTSDDSKSRIFILPFAGGEPKQVTANGPTYGHKGAPSGILNQLALRRTPLPRRVSQPVGPGRGATKAEHLAVRHH